MTNNLPSVEVTSKEIKKITQTTQLTTEESVSKSASEVADKLVQAEQLVLDGMIATCKSIRAKQDKKEEIKVSELALFAEFAAKINTILSRRGAKQDKTPPILIQNNSFGSNKDANLKPITFVRGQTKDENVIDVEVDND